MTGTAPSRPCRIGPVLAAVIVAEIGDVCRFSCLRRLCCWAGLTPTTVSPTSR